MNIMREVKLLFALFLISWSFLRQDEGADLPFAPPMKGPLFLVPNGIRPVMQRTAIEVCGLVKIVCLVVQIWLEIAFTRTGELNFCN